MKKLCVVLIVVAIVVVVVGFYRDWFAVSSGTPDADADKVNVNVTVDREKMKQDAEAMKKRTTEFTGKVAKEADELGDRAKASEADYQQAEGEPK